MTEPPSILAETSGSLAWSPESSFPSPFLPSGLVQASLFAGEEGVGAGGGGVKGVEVGPGARASLGKTEGRRGTGPKPRAGPARAPR